MDESQMRLLIADELKEMRKGGGLPKYDMRGNSLLAAAFDHHNSLMRSHLEEELLQMRRETGAGALNAALAIGSRDKWPNLNDMPADELTLRRRSYAERTNVSERTLSRHEDEAIETLANRLVARFREEPFKSRIEKHSVYGHNRVGAETRNYTRGPTTGGASTTKTSADSLPTDLPSLLKLQARTAGELADLHKSAAKKADLLETISERLASMWGVQL